MNILSAFHFCSQRFGGKINCIQYGKIFANQIKFFYIFTIDRNFEMTHFECGWMWRICSIQGKSHIFYILWIFHFCPYKWRGFIFGSWTLHHSKRRYFLCHCISYSTLFPICQGHVEILFQWFVGYLVKCSSINFEHSASSRRDIFTKFNLRRKFTSAEHYLTLSRLFQTYDDKKF